MKVYKTLKELHEAVQAGDVDEASLTIVMDNDCSDIMSGPAEDDKGNEVDNTIYRGKGYGDIDDLWPLLFPKADVMNC
jgi:hypothetical protein